MPRHHDTTRPSSIATLPPQRFPIPRRGHAALPGGGPKGQTCGNCAHLVRGQGASRCDLSRPAVGQRWQTVSRRDPACKLWEAEVSEVVKVQVPISPSIGPLMIYDRQRNHVEFRDRDDVLRRELAETKKGYYRATWKPKESRWQIGGRAPEQGW